MRYNSTLLILLLFFAFHASSQCAPPEPLPVIACGTGQELTPANPNINPGETRFTNGGTFSMINLSGGTLVICGNVAVTNQTNFNSGTIVINPGATVTFQNQFNSSGSASRFYNSGTVRFDLSVPLVVQGQNHFIYNESGGFITVNGEVHINNGVFVNNGTVTADLVRVQDNSTVCLGSTSAVDVGVLDSEAVPSGGTGAVIVEGDSAACISVRESLEGSEVLTLQEPPHLRICNQTGTAFTSTQIEENLGTATEIFPCSGCGAGLPTLPLTLISFAGNVLDGRVALEWKSGMEEEVKSFVIERSYNGTQFEAVGEVVARNQPSEYTFTTKIDKDSYFRLKMQDLNGSFTYSRTILLKFTIFVNQIRLIPNPATGAHVEVSIDLISNQTGEIVIVDNTGRLVKRVQARFRKGNNALHIDLDKIGQGQYYIYYEGSGTRLKAMPFIKL